MGKIISYETAVLAKKFGYDEYTSAKYNADRQYVFHTNGNNIPAPTQDQLQTWLETRGLYVSIAPEFYADGINWNWQVLWYLPKNTWEWEEYEDEGKIIKHARNIVTGTGYYGDNGEYPTRHLAMEAALQMALNKTDLMFRHNSVDKLAKLYNMDMNGMLSKLRTFSDELGDWSFRDLTEQQLATIVSKLGPPPSQE